MFKINTRRDKDNFASSDILKGLLFIIGNDIGQTAYLNCTATMLPSKCFDVFKVFVE